MTVEALLGLKNIGPKAIEAIEAQLASVARELVRENPTRRPATREGGTGHN